MADQLFDSDVHQIGKILFRSRGFTHHTTE
jgi:hypothetical protein